MKFASDISLYRELRLKLILKRDRPRSDKNIRLLEARKVGLAFFQAILSYKDARKKIQRQLQDVSRSAQTAEDGYIFIIGLTNAPLYSAAVFVAGDDRS